MRLCLTSRLASARVQKNYAALYHCCPYPKLLGRRWTTSKGSQPIAFDKSRAWVSKLLSGHQNATLDTLADVAWALGAKWQIDMVAADRIGTPAENDPPPPHWAVRSSSTTTMTVSDSPGAYWTHQRSGAYQLNANIMHMNSYDFYVLVDPHIYHGSNLERILAASGIQGTPKRVVASATASLQFSEVPT